jgi:predicted Zn-dependent peptidase
MDELFDAIKAERRKTEPDQARLEQLQKQFEAAQDEAQKYIEHDEYEDVYQKEGCSSFNAFTGQDYTCYIVSLPSNKVELWMSLESDRFANPVLREFYKERNVVMEERRMGENTPGGHLREEFEAIAYLAHPYGKSIVGHMSDLQTLTRCEAENFFRKYYCPSNLTIAIAGDVNPEEIKRLAEKYFGPIPSGPKPEPVETIEPLQRGERRVVIEDPSQPQLRIGYHIPDIRHTDYAVFQAIGQIMDRGRTSRLYKSLVKGKKIAIMVRGGMSWSKYPGLFTFWAVPSKGHTGEECEQAVYDQIEKLKTELVMPEELRKAKTHVRAGIIRQLDSNFSLAMNLAFYDVLTGDWRNLFRELDKIEQVTADDIQRVAKEYFTRKNRSVGIMKTTPIDN